MPTVNERLAILETEVKELRRVLASNSSFGRWMIGQLIQAALLVTAVLVAMAAKGR